MKQVGELFFKNGRKRIIWFSYFSFSFIVSIFQSVKLTLKWFLHKIFISISSFNSNLPRLENFFKNVFSVSIKPHYSLPTIPINLPEKHPQTTSQNPFSTKFSSPQEPNHKKGSINDSWKRISFAFKWSISRQYKILINCGSYFPSVCHKISLSVCMNITEPVANDT